jgi:hypothetical protein
MLMNSPKLQKFCLYFSIYSIGLVALGCILGIIKFLILGYFTHPNLCMIFFRENNCIIDLPKWRGVQWIFEFFLNSNLILLGGIQFFLFWFIISQIHKVWKNALNQETKDTK